MGQEAVIAVHLDLLCVASTESQEPVPFPRKSRFNFSLKAGFIAQAEYLGGASAMWCLVSLRTTSSLFKDVDFTLKSLTIGLAPGLACQS